MTGKPTTFKVTRMLQYLQKEILEATMLSKTAFQRKAIDVFLAGDQKINPAFKITSHKDPSFVEKEAVEQIYLDDARRARLQEVADRENVGITVVLFQCVYDYCILMSELVDPRIIQNIIGGGSNDV